MYLDNFIPFSMNKPLLLRGLVAAKSGTMNVYTHIGFDDAEEELKRMEEFRKAQAEVEQNKEKTVSQKMFKVI